MNLKHVITTRRRLDKTLLTALFLVLSLSAFAQKTTVNGTVTGAEDGLPIPGVAIVVQGTSVGTVSDFDGNYTIQANMGDVLVFSYLGLIDEKVKVTKSQINVAMDADLEDLEEVVVIGYGTQKKKELTGAVAQVKSDDIEQFITSDVSNALQGQIAGVNVTAASGEPGEAANIQIRGVTSLSGSNTPLYVVNGIPQIGDPGLAPNEIETIDILKDAASTAVYGARGAAGVILITTKQGKSGQMNIDFSYTYGIQAIHGEGTPLMNTESQLTYEVNRRNYSSISFNPLIERFPEWINNDNEFDDFVLNRAAEVKTYNFTVSGGADKFSYSIVGGVFDQDGSIINSNFKRYNGRATTTYKTDNWNIQGSIAYTIENRRRSSTGLITTASRYSPYYPYIDPNADSSEIGDTGGVRTPAVALNQALRRKDDSNRDRINASLKLDRKLSNTLNFVTNVGTSISNDKRNIFRPNFILIDVEDDLNPEVDPTRSGIVNIAQRTTKFNWDASLNFRKQFGDHSLTLSATIALEEDSFTSFDAYIEGVLNNSISVLDGGSISESVNSGFNEDNNAPGTQDNYNKKTVGTLGRLQYNYKGKYLLSALVRRDGSSRFGSNFRWGTFPSVSFAWNVSDEPFWKPLKLTVNRLKLRLSHGTVGNDSFRDYAYASTIAPFGDYVFDPADSGEEFGTSIRSYANADVKWETSVSNNIGVDFGLFKNKISVTADYYHTKKRDMLFPVTLPGSGGALYSRTLTLNIGDMENKGFELSTNYRTKIGKSKLRIGATFTTNENEVTKIIDGVEKIPNANVRLVNQDPDITFIAKGREAGAFFLYETDGVIQTVEERDEYRTLGNREGARLGDLKYVDTNGDGKIDNDDRVYKGSGLPDYELGLNLRWDIGNFDLSMNWYATVGAEILNGNKALIYNYQRHQDLANMWTPDNPTSNIPLFQGEGRNHPNYIGATDLWVEDGDYVRLKQVTLGYSLPKDVSNRIGLDKARIYLSAQNALTFTKYSGFDPEVGSNNVARRGIDSSKYPLAAIYSLGIKLDF
ncbi:TonB-dependent receptor [Flavivirga abyssicola]|uniref:SusC/RagA family TonB-linked outer membrane protein n=1 Tax=Flavivirga abyssicola TaxID=3063533 RepID=UPI0026DF3CF3|nr:TonB-dependent receptor [Flavivirga sp. MEBiC07777]WVK13749.1 TonB-dependent receptor [Flavivirga sp. MEBiC07777]